MANFIQSLRYACLEYWHTLSLASLALEEICLWRERVVLLKQVYGKNAY